MDFEFVDFVTRARELGLTEATFRARVLNRYDEMPCFIHLSGCYAVGTQEEFLPSWSEADFPFAAWRDLGCRVDVNGFSNNTTEERRPRYYLTGWFAITEHAFSEVFFRGKIFIDTSWIYAVNADLSVGIPLQLNVQPDKEWVESGGYEEGGYYRDTYPVITKDKLYWLSLKTGQHGLRSSRKENSYLGIIAAMRSMLMDEDCGGFPSQAKVIAELENRYGDIEGVSKRNLEKVFADAARLLGVGKKPRR
jgi:hypothetical protein